MARAFAGVRILDLSRLLPGAYCSLLFADLGAEVIKVEEPGRGDYARSSRPHWGDSGIGAYFLLLNRNKKSLSLDLKAEAGKAVFRRLVETADVLLESFRPGVMDRLGLGWTTLTAINPRLVYCAISGYGQDGPYRDLVGHDVNYLGYAGALAVTGPRDGAPLVPGVQVADLGGGALPAAFAIAAALYHRRESGRGQFLDVSMTDGVVSWMAAYLGPWFGSGHRPARGEERVNGGWPCYGVYEAADGRYLTLGALEPKFWANLCRVIGREDLVPLQHAQGVERDRVEAVLRAVFRTRARDEWLGLLQATDVCAGPVLELDEVTRDRHLRARGVFAEVTHPTIGPMPQVAFPVRMSATPGRIERAAPDLGADSDAILASLGYSAPAIAALRKDGVV
ncbi:MAG TPA: CaiB/BaiF CoA-transferase family protein [Methylomirabilota bacterium]|nr:CaiB/BaiF CoA-transferase family protein [Methylomirabilota bacterium]